MSVQQKLKDLALLIQRDRKWQVGTFIVLVFIVMSLWYEPRPKRQRPRPSTPVGAGAMGKGEAYEDLMHAFNRSLEELKVETKENRQRTEELQENITNMEERTSQIFKKILERMESEASLRNQQQPPGPIEVSGAGQDIPDPNPDELVTFGGVHEPLVGPPPAAKIKKTAYIGAGDSVRVKLLAGVNAPTDGTPYPVVFKLIDDVAGPDQSQLPLGEARLIAAAQGSLTDSRALFRLHTLNVRFPNGQRKVMDVDGWVVGEDGLRGMAGVLLDPLGKAIGAQAIAGAASGLGQGLSASQVRTFVDRNGNAFANLNGDLGTFMAGRALNGAANEWSDVIRDRVDDLVPHVQVYSGREATAVFSRSVSIKGLYDMLEEEDDVFASLD